MRFGGPDDIGQKFKVFVASPTESGGSEASANIKTIDLTDGKAWGDIGDKPTFSTKTTLKAVHSMTPEDAKAKLLANAQMEYDFRGEGYGKVRDDKGRITHRVYADKAGNVDMFIEYSYNSDGTINNTKNYSLRNGQYVHEFKK